jgi:hypothetical protein
MGDERPMGLLPGAFVAAALGSNFAPVVVLGAAHKGVATGVVRDVVGGVGATGGFTGFWFTDRATAGDAGAVGGSTLAATSGSGVNRNSFGPTNRTTVRTISPRTRTCVIFIGIFTSWRRSGYRNPRGDLRQSTVLAKVFSCFP